ITQIKSTREKYELCDNMTRALLCSKVKGKAQQWLHSKSNYVVEPIDTIMDEMSIVFGKNENKFTMRRKFESRKWQLVEEFSSYFNEKLILSNGLNMDEQEFIHYAVEGILDLQLRNQV
ncbi:hypothetical protein KR222_006683, partial [Zaprionus bogoriensis]